MALAGIELRYLINDISIKTREYYVSNIYGITKDSILFKLHHPEKPDIFLMLSTFGLWITDVKIDQIEPHKLTKRLRSDLLRLRISKIEQLEDERIAYLTFSGFDKEFIIVAEFFGDGNIILCNKEMKILALQHSLKVRHRELRVGLVYSPPPQNRLNIFKVSQSNIDEIQNADMGCAKWVGRTLGLPSRYIDEIFNITKIDPKTSSRALSAEQRKAIFTTVIDIITRVSTGKHEPILVREGDNIDIYPIRISSLKDDFESVPTFGKGLDALFTQYIIQRGKTTQSSTENKKLQQLQTQLEEQNKAIITVKEKSKEISSIARLLQEMVSMGIISISEDRAIEELAKQNIELVNEKGLSLIKINEEKIKINTKSTLPSIASILFDEAKKQSMAIPSIEKLKEKTEKNIEKLKNAVGDVEKSVTFSEIQKKNWYERYRWFFTSENYLAIGGRDASSNSSIIRKHLEKNDIVFHAQIFGSPFFILKDGANASPTSLNEVAQATVSFSRAWREAMYGTSAYWVSPEQVKKAAPSGQFLPKGSFTIEGQRNFLRVESLSLTVGIVKQNERYILVCGPTKSVKKECLCYATIEPTGSIMTDVAKKIRTEFIKIDEEMAKSIDIDEFVRVLPAGEARITKTGISKVET